MMSMRSLKQKRPFQSADSGECWRRSASAAGKQLDNNNHGHVLALRLMGQYTLTLIHTHNIHSL